MSEPKFKCANEYEVAYQALETKLAELQKENERLHKELICVQVSAMHHRGEKDAHTKEQEKFNAEAIEKIAELTERRDHWRASYENDMKEFKAQKIALEAKLQKAVDALRFYGEGGHMPRRFGDDDYYEAEDGEHARAALKDLGEP